MTVVFMLPLVWSFIIGLALLFNPVLAGLDAPSTSSAPAAALVAPIAQPTVTQPVTSGPVGVDDYVAYSKGAGARPPGADVFLDTVESRVFDLLNAERKSAGIAPLAVDDLFSTAARSHSRDMLSRGYFAHVTPEGISPADRVASVHRRHVGTSGENIWSLTGAYTAEADKIAKKAMADLMRSLGHKENILRDTYTHVGIGVAADANGVRLTQVFGGRRALLKVDLPMRVKAGTPLALDAVPVAGSKPPERFALFSTEKGKAVFGPEPIGSAGARVHPDQYRLQLYFAEGKNWSISFGPDLKVVP